MANEPYTFTEAHRAMFTNIVEAKPYMRNGKAVGDPVYGATFLVPPDHPDLAAIKAAAVKVAKERWPGRALKELKFPFMDGDTQATEREKLGKSGDATKGFVMFKTSTKYEPVLTVLENGRIVEYTGTNRGHAARKFYAGAYLVPSVTLHAYEGDSTKPDGVGAWLNAVLFYKDGERIGGAAGAELFKGFAGAVSTTDPTSASDDEDIF